jgi:hypothetical protein
MIDQEAIRKKRKGEDKIVVCGERSQEEPEPIPDKVQGLYMDSGPKFQNDRSNECTNCPIFSSTYDMRLIRTDLFSIFGVCTAWGNGPHPVCLGVMALIVSSKMGRVCARNCCQVL